MGLNFRKSISLGKGFKLNLSKGGVGVSFGKKGLRQSISSTGRMNTTIGIPGTGVYYTKQTNAKKLAKTVTNKFSKKGQAKATNKAEQAKAEKAAANEAAIEENENTVAEFEQYCESLKSIHKMSDGLINWEQVNKGEVPSNIIKGSEEYNEWVGLQKFSQRILDGDIDAYFEVIDEFKPFDDLLEYGSNFQIGTDRPDKLEVEFGVMFDDVLPEKAYSLTSTGKLSEKDMTKTAYFDLMQDYVCSTAIRVARDAFALLPVDTVIVHAVDTMLNTATGFEDEITLLSVKFDRATIMSLNMGMVDPSDAIGNFQANVKFKKTAGFDPVERIAD